MERTGKCKLLECFHEVYIIHIMMWLKIISAVCWKYYKSARLLFEKYYYFEISISLSYVYYFIPTIILSTILF